jgi:hypothetical protein
MLCVSCRPVDLGEYLFPPAHCHGTGDQPATSGVLGSGFHCTCSCRKEAEDG